MRVGSLLLALAQALAISSTLGQVLAARGQPDLPPPPPPPLGETEPPRPARAPAPPPAATTMRPPPPHHAPPAAATAASPPPPRPPRRVMRTTAPPSVDESPRPYAITVNLMPLVLGRLSANIEVKLAPHHSVIASPNVLVAQVGRGGHGSLASVGFGYATMASAGAGIELGYHYWWRGQPALRGPFVGPSLLFGTTTQAGVGDGSRAQAYWGGAIDLGAQEVFSGGLTVGGGAGLGFVRMADATGAFPRFLLQVGWSF